MHEEQNNAPVKTVQSNRQEANFPNLEEKENLKELEEMEKLSKEEN